MKRLLLLNTLIICVIMSVEAQLVNQQDAKKLAKNFYYEKHNQYSDAIAYRDVLISESYTAREGETICYHVFNMHNGGYVIVSATKYRLPVIGYDFRGRFNYEDMPGIINRWTERHDAPTSFAIEQDQLVHIWEYYLDEDFQYKGFEKSIDAVEPLLTSAWRQKWPYNYYCPEGLGGPGGRAYAGCAAIVQAQICYYWQWPDHGIGSHCYIPNLNPEYGEQCADYENTWYNWDEMTDEVYEYVNYAIAELFYHTGVSIDMDYTP
ncbi:MAG: C10 family peptidase, partial [Bacteroidota bacterium]